MDKIRTQFVFQITKREYFYGKHRKRGNIVDWVSDKKVEAEINDDDPGNGGHSGSHRDHAADIW